MIYKLLYFLTSAKNNFHVVIYFDDVIFIMKNDRFSKTYINIAYINNDNIKLTLISAPIDLQKSFHFCK